MKLNNYILPMHDDKAERYLSKIYISCHPKDIYLYFEIEKLIGDKCDCSFWFTDEINELWTANELEEKLFLMNLFVVPITKRYLNDESRSKSQEVPFAINKNIPILFIIMEKDCEKKFCKEFGDLQYLDKFQNSKIGLSYESKLKKFLDSVLVKSNTQIKIKNAFEVNVFLSYRKKDKQYALELMNKIYEDRNLRTVAIWYDDYLTLGENFNNSIEKKIIDSDLFFLIVTPNLLELGNYVLDKEYPMAKRENKAILSFECKATDSNELNKLYPELPKVIDISDEEKIKKELKHISKKYIKNKISSKEELLERKYYLGIAFLHGIYVAKIPIIGIQLLTSASKEGYINAHKILVNIYNEGIGTKENIKKAIYYQKKLVNYYISNYTTNNQIAYFDGFVEESLNLAQLYEKEKKYLKTIEMYKHLRGYIVNLEISNKNKYLTIIQERLAKIQKKVKIKKSIVYYLELLKLYQESNYPELNIRCILANHEIADLYKELKDYKKANCLYSKIIDNYKNYLKINKKSDMFQNLEMCCESYYQCLYDIGKVKDAFDMLNEIESFYNCNIAQSNHLEIIFSYLNILDFSAKKYFENNLVDKSEDYYMKIKDIIEKDKIPINTVNEWIIIWGKYVDISNFYQKINKKDLMHHYIIEGIRKLINSFEKHPTLDNSENNFVLWCCFEYAAKYNELEFVELGNKLCRIGLEFCKKIENKYEYEIFGPIKKYGFTIWGEIKRKIGDFKEANQMIQQNLYTSNINSEPETLEDWLSLANLYWLDSVNIEPFGELDLKISLSEKRFFCMTQFAKFLSDKDKEKEINHTRISLAKEYKYLERYNDAEKVLLQCYKNVRCEFEEFSQLPYLCTLGKTYDLKHNYRKSIKYFNEVERIVETKTQVDKIAIKQVFDTYHYLIEHYIYINNIEKAIKLSNYVLYLMNMQELDYLGGAQVKYVILDDNANCMMLTNNYLKAEKNYLDIEKIFIKYKEEKFVQLKLAQIYKKLSEVYFYLKDAKKEIEYADKSINIIEKLFEEEYDYYTYTECLKIALYFKIKKLYKTNMEIIDKVFGIVVPLYEKNPNNVIHKNNYEILRKLLN